MVDTVLRYADQALFLGLRAAGHEAVIQVFWLYRRRIDIAGVERFRSCLQQGLLARLIEPSPLPFGRHRWVSATYPPDRTAALAEPLDPVGFYDWADAQIGLPLDPERGPGWRLDVQPFTDGTTAVSLVVSHCIADGAAVVSALADAATGVVHSLGLPPPGSRTRRQALAADLRQALRDSRPTGRALGAGLRTAVRRGRGLVRPASPGPPITPGSRLAVVPSATAFVDAGRWDERAEALGGNGFSLVAGVAAACAQRLGRTNRGSVTLTIPLSRRAGGDDLGDADLEGNAVSLATVRVDPAGLTSDLTPVRTSIRAGLQDLRHRPDEMAELSPLVPFVPGRAAGRIADVALGFSADQPVSVSNMGDMPAEITRLDGTAADRFWFRGMDRNVTESALQRRRGVLTVMSGRVGGDTVVTLISHQPGTANTRRGARDLLVSVLAEFELTAEIA